MSVEGVAELATAAPEAKEASPVDVAAREFQIYMPLFKKHMESLSNKAKDRVIVAIMEFPLFNKKPVFRADIERDLFDIGCRILDAKVVMITEFLKEKMARPERPVEEASTQSAGVTNE